MKLSDFIVQFLAEQGLKHVFVVSGGAIIHTIDSVTRHPDVDYICVQHEQSAGAAADAYARVTGNLGAVLVTSGPGATNLTTSICNAYFDSIPVLFICGQVSTFRLKNSDELRQKGFQETDIVSLFKSITNYVVQVLDPLDIQYELQKAVFLAKNGRPGPVVLDIPDDLQRIDLNVSELRQFIPPVIAPSSSVDEEIQTIGAWIKSAKRPVLIFGAGVRNAKAQDQALKFARHFQIPVLLTWGAKDLLPHTDELNMGVFGVCGPRGGNFAIQNSDLVIAIGTRLSQQITGGKQDLFAPTAKKVLIDIDPCELNKFNPLDLNLDLKVRCEIREFLERCEKLMRTSVEDQHRSWRELIKSWCDRYPICHPDKYRREQNVDAHVFVKELSQVLKGHEIIIPDTGANIAWTLQTIEVKGKQRIFSAWNHTPMGYSLPAAIGAALAGDGQEVICLIGDGGLMMCLPELATIKRYNLPVKVFIFNNHGHAIQKQTIDIWLKSNYAAVDHATGLSFPDFLKLAESFGLPACSIENHSQLADQLKFVFQNPGPVLCNVEIDPEQKIEPMLKFGKGLEHLSPNLPANELAAIMSVSQSPVKDEPQTAKIEIGN